jgi:hypothetical protein
MGEAMKGLFENYWRRRQDRGVADFQPARTAAES